MTLVEHELPTLLEHLNPPRWLVGFVLLNLQFLCSVLQIVICLFVLVSFGHFIGCHSSIYDFWLLLWYLQAFLKWYSCHSTIHLYNTKKTCIRTQKIMNKIWKTRPDQHVQKKYTSYIVLSVVKRQLRSSKFTIHLFLEQLLTNTMWQLLP